MYLPGPSYFYSNRPLSSEDLYLYFRAVYFQITSGLKYFNLNKLTVKGIFTGKDFQYRKMRITIEFFGVDLPRNSRITRNYLVLAKNHT